MMPEKLGLGDLERAQQYNTLIEISDDTISGDLERYYIIRACIVNGCYTRAKILVEQKQPNRKLSSFIRRFLRLQLDIYERKLFLDARQGLLSLSPPSVPYLVAELNFAIGYTYLNLDDYRKASAFFIKASRLYAEEQFPLHEANCYYNLCLCHQTLNETDELLREANRLEAIAQRNSQHSAPKHLLLRLKAHIALDQENYFEAADFFIKMIETYKSFMCPRELGDAYCSLAVCFLLVSRLNEFDLMCEALRLEVHELDKSHQWVIEIIQQIRFTNYFTKKDIDHFFDSLFEEKFLSGYFLNILHLLMESLMRQRSFSTLLTAARKAINICLKRHRFSTLPTFRYYEIFALIHLGKRHKALTLFYSYKLLAKKSGYLQQNKKAEQLERYLLESRLPDSKDPIPVKINYHDLSIQVGGEHYILKNKPLLFKSICVLALSPEPLPFEMFFKRIYGSDFISERHLSRANSLLIRIKSIVGQEGLVRKNHRLSLSNCFEVSVSNPSLIPQTIPKRRKAITEYIRNSSHPVSISELERNLTYNRRTLQLDLQKLVEKGILEFRGLRKSRKYVTKPELAPL